MFVGTHAENIADRERKGRHKHKKTYDHEKIIDYLKVGFKHRDIIDMTGISRTQLKRIVKKNNLYRKSA